MAAEIADLIAAQTRVRVGKVEGVIVSARRIGDVGTFVLDVGGGSLRESGGPVEELEPVDMDKVRAYHEAADAAAALADAQKAAGS